jgi:hypothetical protein
MVPRAIDVKVTVYGDESGTHDGPGGSSIMMLSGYVSTLDQWNRFDRAWKHALRFAGLPGYYHATEHWDTNPGQQFGPIAMEKQRDILFLAM